MELIYDKVYVMRLTEDEFHALSKLIRLSGDKQDEELGITEAESMLLEDIAGVIDDELEGF